MLIYAVSTYTQNLGVKKVLVIILLKHVSPSYFINRVNISLLYNCSGDYRDARALIGRGLRIKNSLVCSLHCKSYLEFSFSCS